MFTMSQCHLSIPIINLCGTGRGICKIQSYKHTHYRMNHLLSFFMIYVDQSAMVENVKHDQPRHHKK